MDIILQKVVMMVKLTAKQLLQVAAKTAMKVQFIPNKLNKISLQTMERDLFLR